MALEGEKQFITSLSFANDSDGVVFPIEDEFSLYSVREGVLNEAAKAGMSPHGLNELEIIIRELVTNVITHGGKKGKIVVRHTNDNDEMHITLDVIDHGPGFRDFEQALEDGYSTRGSMGGGLSCVQRFSERVELVHNSPTGSHLRVTKRINYHDKHQQDWSFALYNKPHPESYDCGDRGTLIRNDEGILLVLADGLGHGPDASTASRLATETAHTSHRMPLLDLIHAMHKKLRQSRGSAVSLARIVPEKHRIDWIGIGNVRGCLLHPEKTDTFSETLFANFNGTIGNQLDSFRIISYPYQPGDWIILYSDGVNEKWRTSLKDAPQLTPAFVGKHIITHAATLHDDASVLIGRSC